MIRRPFPRHPWIVIERGRSAYYLASPIALTLATPVYKAFGPRYRGLAEAIASATAANDEEQDRLRAGRRRREATSHA